MGMAQLVERYWTAEDVRALPEDGKRYECIDGALLVTPAPRRLHQRACNRLVRLLDSFVDRNALGDLHSSPADIELEPGTLVQPDVFIALDRPGNPPYEWHSIAGLLLATNAGQLISWAGLAGSRWLAYATIAVLVAGAASRPQLSAAASVGPRLLDRRRAL